MKAKRTRKQPMGRPYPLAGPTAIDVDRAGQLTELTCCRQFSPDSEEKCLQHAVRRAFTGSLDLCRNVEGRRKRHEQTWKADDDAESREDADGRP
jgi:hypothetical protein